MQTRSKIARIRSARLTDDDLAHIAEPAASVGWQYSLADIVQEAIEARKQESFQVA